MLSISYEKFSRRIFWGSWLLLHIPFPFPKRRWKCRACRYQWKETRIDPNHAKAHYNLGVASSKQGKLDEAIAEYKRAIIIDPYFTDSHYNLASVYALKNEKALAIESLEEAITLDSRFVETSKTNSDFDNIRESPEFQELIK